MAGKQTATNKTKRSYTAPKQDANGIKRNKDGSTSKHNAPNINDPAAKERKKVLRTLELAAIDTPVALIASTLGETKQAITKIIDEYKHVYPQLANLSKLSVIKRELIDASMYQSLESLNDPTKIEGASLRDSAYAFDVLHRASRLEHNQSTSNTAILSFTQDAKSLDDI